ncbi:MAG: glutamate--tRNA ligase, partial [Candidatus Pacebacteria bacterium]|nr:glutamate--tRNA ligase [Candidatus Paceibacterota bacterium]
KEPLYNFSCAIDDFEMKISHVIRGDDHIANTPKQILIQQALDFPTPKYAHLPMILADDKSKLSKRKHGNIASVENFKEKGYLPETMVNFLAFLGWNPGTEREIFSMNSLIKEFGLDRVKKGGAIFNVKRLDYLNGFYIRKKSLEKLTQECIPYLIEAEFVEPVFKDQERMPDFIGQFGKEIVLKFIIKQTKQEVSFDYIQKIVSIYQERLKKLEEIIELTEFFFKQELEYSKELLKWKDQSDEELGIVLNKLERKLSDIKYNNWNKQTIENTLIGQENSVGSILWPFRTALTGKKASAGPFDIAEILGKDKALERIRNAKKLI